MNDLSSLLAKILPVVVIASLGGIFYLLDVFSVRAGVDNALPKRAAVVEPLPRSNPKPLSTFTPVTDRAVVPPVSSEAPPQGSPENSPPEASMEAAVPLDPPSQPMAPRYVPPGANEGQPLATDMNNGQDPVQLPNHEISQQEAERIEAEAQQQINETEAAAAAEAAAEGQLEQQKE
jgi:hypothetical protein